MKIFLFLVTLFFFNGCTGHLTRDEQLKYDNWYKDKQDERNSRFDKAPERSYQNRF